MAHYRRHAVDGNQKEIVKTLRRVGVTVVDLSQGGKDRPDILCGWLGKNYLFEIKEQKGVLTPNQEKWFLLWRGQAAVIKSAGDALKIMGIKTT